MTETDFCQKINHIWHYKCYRHLYERLRDVLQKKNWLKTFGKNTNKQKIIIKKQIYVPHFKKSSDIRGSTLMGTFINSKWATFTQEVCCCGFVVSQGLVCLVNLCSLTTKSQPSPWRLKDKTWNLFSIKASRLPLSLNEPSDGGVTVEGRWRDGGVTVRRMLRLTLWSSLSSRWFCAWMQLKKTVLRSAVTPKQNGRDTLTRPLSRC